ncbi:uncharacterized protein [Paramormyrops kingsleyae]|uniref:uncharacterized protein n=1 Tax=Paramormyrops kingsleyae TaxID=1676925 RepID=UPI000CD604BA|nr:zinc finger protein 226-like [Paramormyrops kingsleyae]
MAVVYTVNGGRLQADDDGLPSEDRPVSVTSVVWPLLDSTKTIKVEDTSGHEDPVPTDSLSSGDHAAATHVAPLITIKEERIEDEEYFQIKLGDIGGSLDDKIENKDGSDKDSVNVELPSLMCPDCEESFSNWEAFNIHLRQHGHSEEAKKQMLVLNKEKKNTKLAEKGKDLNLKYQEEEVCLPGSSEAKSSKVFKLRSSVSVRSRTKKPFYGSSPKVYACGTCGKVYSYLESFRNHQRMHQDNPEKPSSFNCSECGKIFHRASSLASHMKVHRTLDDPDNFSCDQCNKTFNSHLTWMSHQEIHKRKPFWCVLCAKGFKDSKGLDRHQLGHDLKRHKCNVCSKTFRVPAELRYHYNTHTGAKPYSCGLCWKTFSQLGNLITHRKKHVGVYKEGSETPLGFQTKQFAGKRKVTVMKKLIVVVKGEDEEATGAEVRLPDQEVQDEEYDSETSADSEEESGGDGNADEQEGDLQCYECGTLFREESELHQHYMKHASGEL